MAAKSVTSYDVSSEVKRKSTELDKNDFLRLMISQLQHQDPLKPLSNEEFVAQMAQFSSLEQMTNLSTTMETFTSNMTGMQAGNMIGWKVTGIDADGNTVSGTVTGVSFSDGKAVLKVGDKTLPLSGLSEMSA